MPYFHLNTVQITSQYQLKQTGEGSSHSLMCGARNPPNHPHGNRQHQQEQKICQTNDAEITQFCFPFRCAQIVNPCNCISIFLVGICLEQIFETSKRFIPCQVDKGSHMHHTVNPRISPLGAYLFSKLLKDLVYFRRNLLFEHLINYYQK